MSDNFTEKTIGCWEAATDKYVPKGSLIKLKEYTGEKMGVMSLDISNLVGTAAIVHKGDQYIETTLFKDDEYSKTREFLADDTLQIIKTLEKENELIPKAITEE